MAPLIVLVLSFGLFLALRRFGVRVFSDWITGLRWALALMFLLTASAHFNWMRADLVRMVPDFVPNPEFWVTLTGITETAGAIGLGIPRLAPFAAAGLALLLVAVFPANVRAALSGLTFDGKPATPLALRTLEQLLFLASVVTAGFWRGRFPALRSRASVRTRGQAGIV